MGSSSHTQGRGERLSSIGERSIVSLLDQRRQSEADIRYEAIYIRPLGRGIHLIKNICNDQEYKVSSLNGSATYTPGQVVVVGSHTGHPDEFIMGNPPAGKRGASLYPIVRHSRIYRKAPETCPVCLTGRNYLALFIDSATDTLWAYSYEDGDPQDLIATKAWTGDLPGENISNSQAFYHPLTNSVILRTNSRDHIVTWDLGDNTLAVNELHSTVEVYGFGLIGSTIYLYDQVGSSIYPMICDIGDTGVNGAGFDNIIGTGGGGEPLGASVGNDLMTGYMSAGPLIPGWQHDGIDYTDNSLFSWPDASNPTYNVTVGASPDDYTTVSHVWDIGGGQLVHDGGGIYLGNVMRWTNITTIVPVFPQSWADTGQPSVSDGLASDDAASWVNTGDLTMTCVAMPPPGSISEDCPIPTIPWSYPTPAPTGNLAVFFPLS